MVFRGKRRYCDPNHPLWEVVTSRRVRLQKAMVFHHVLNLMRAYRWERQLSSGRIKQTDRYKAWVTSRDEAHG